MKRLLLASLLFAHQALAGLPPTTTKGQTGTKSTTFNFQSPFQQLTKTGGTTALIETGNMNILANPGFEATTFSTGWTASGGSSSVGTSTDIGTGLKSYGWDASASSQTLTSTAVAVPAGFYGISGQASCRFKTTATDYSLQVYDGTNVLSTQTISGTSTFTRQTIYFPMPTSGNISLRLSSGSDASIVYIDDCFLGSNQNISSIAQATYYGGMDQVGASGCIRQENTSTGASDYQDIGSGSGCNSWTTYGNITASSSNSLNAVANNMPSGEYLIHIDATFDESGAANQNCYYRLSDGTNNTVSQYLSASPAALSHNGMTWRMSYTSAASRTFKLQASDDGSLGCRVNSNGPGADVSWKFYRFPTSSEMAVNLNTTPNYWSGYHDSTCSWNRTNTAYGDPTADTTCAFTERQNNNFGTVTSYLSGSDKLPGIVFTPKVAQAYYICANYNTQPNITAVGANLNIQLADGSSNQLAETSEMGLVSANAISNTTCAIFNATNINSQTLKLQTKASAGQITIGNGAGNAIEWSIFPISQNLPLPFVSSGPSYGSSFITSGTTYTTPSNNTTATNYRFTLVGGGGGSGGVAATANLKSSGGGAGGVCVHTATGLAPGTTYTIAIGAAGSAGSNAPGAGGNGGNTTLTIGSTTYTAGGGVGSPAGNAANKNGGAGGTTTNCSTAPDFGLVGQTGFPTNSAANSNNSGAGGNTGFNYGLGGAPINAGGASAGNAATGYGGGGGGSSAGAAGTANVGAAGTQGLILVEFWNN